MRQLAPGYLDWDASRVSGGDIQPDFLDLIWERQDGVWVLVYEKFVNDRGDIAAAKEAAVPQHSPNHVRLTYSQARVYTWDGYEGSSEEPPSDQELIYIQAAPHGWNSARIIFYVQNGRWYENEKIDGKNAATYYPDLITFLEQNRAFCGGPNVDCYIAPISCVEQATKWKWSACDKSQKVLDLNKINRCVIGGDPDACNDRDLVTAEHAAFQAAYHLIDLVPLLSAKSNEYAGHNGPVAGLWTWFALFNSLPEAAAHFGPGRPGSSCEHETVEFTPSCLIQSSDGSARIYNGCNDCGCVDYVNSLKTDGGWDPKKQPKPWICLLFQPGCNYTRTSVRPPPLPVPPAVEPETLALALARIHCNPKRHP